jgi:hypothetical protein
LKINKGKVGFLISLLKAAKSGSVLGMTDKPDPDPKKFILIHKTGKKGKITLSEGGREGPIKQKKVRKE